MYIISNQMTPSRLVLMEFTTFTSKRMTLLKSPYYNNIQWISWKSHKD